MNTITLEGLLKVIDIDKPLTVNLFNEKGLLLISFELRGFNYLEDFLNDDKILKIELPKINTLNIQIDTSDDPEPKPGPTPTPGQSYTIYLNGEKQTGDEVSFYAPINAGTLGQVLYSNGLNSIPYWGSPAAGSVPTVVGTILCFL